MDFDKALRQPEMWKAIMRLRYRDEWRDSMRDSHPDNENLQKALETSDKECQIILNALGQVIPGFTWESIASFCQENAHQDMDWF